jgi:putative phosphoribosyl transferase
MEVAGGAARGRAGPTLAGREDRRFRDRREAGQVLAAQLDRDRLVQPVVLALPRGGVPVAAEVADRLDAPLDVFVARKIGAPGHEELGIGAIAEGSDELVLSDLARQLHVTPGMLDQMVRREAAELFRRIGHYRGDRPPLPVAGRDVVLVDDGLATGVTAEAALRSLRCRGPRRLLLAVPVCAADTQRRLVDQLTADAVICAISSDRMAAVGAWYDDFRQTSDEEVIQILDLARRRAPHQATHHRP